MRQAPRVFFLTRRREEREENPNVLCPFRRPQRSSRLPLRVFASSREPVSDGRPERGLTSGARRRLVAALPRCATFPRMPPSFSSSLRRDLGTIESYAALLGILIGAGIFKVTTDAWELTGPSVILGYVVLAPALLATWGAYSVYLSTPLGREPGGEYTHLSRTFGGYGIAFVGVWLKIISYIGALAYLAVAFADYVVELS